MATPLAKAVLRREAEALMARIAQLKPYALHMPMVAAGALPKSAQRAIDRHMGAVRVATHRMVRDYLSWLSGPGARAAADEEGQRQLTLVRLRFQAALTQFDLFSDVLTQRSEHEFGVWLAGLDSLAADALRLRQRYYHPPPAVCYLDRGIGAAIRRVRTRLPGGRPNPVAMIRIPRERMIGAGIASSLVHEVGHQGSALLGLVESLQPELRDIQAHAEPQRQAWELWERWISEIVADFWSVAQIGVGSTLGLLSTVSLPRAFIFRVSLDDPHPSPWIRVMLSAEIGSALYPDAQWKRLQALWSRFYPRAGLDPRQERLFEMLETTMPAFVELLMNHRPAALNGAALREAFPIEDRQPAVLRSSYLAWSNDPTVWGDASPTFAFAAIGQARADGRLSSPREAKVIDRLLTRWAIQRVSDREPCGCG